MFEFEMSESVMKAAENALSYASQASYEEENDGFKNASIYFVTTILTKMAHHGILDDMFESSIEKWTESFTLIDASTSRALTLSRLVPPVAKSVRA